MLTAPLLPAPTLSMAYQLAVLEAMGCTRADMRALLEAADMSPALLDQPAARVTEHQFARIYRMRVMDQDDEMPGLFARPMRIGALKTTGLVLMDAKTLHGALLRWSMVLRLLQDEFELQVEEDREDGGLSRIVLHCPAGAPPCKPLALDLILKLIHGLSSWFVGFQLPVVRVDFSFAAPGHAADYGSLYPGPVRFGQPQTALVLETHLMELPLRRTRSELIDFVYRAPQGWLFASFHQTLLGLRVRELLAQHLPAQLPVDEVAAALAMSVRTLHRHLAREGTSFQRVKDDLRRDLAVQRLTQTDLPIALIGAELGFDSPASFNRAFRTWTGDTPGAYRHERHHPLRGQARATPAPSAVTSPAMGDAPKRQVAWFPLPTSSSRA